MTEKIEKLLNDVEKISNKYETIAQATGGNFNIFEIVNISHKEVYMCRLLSELLNPSGSHHQGNIYLKLFFEILKRNYGDKFNLVTPKNAEVLKEEGIEGCRRIDITIDDIENKQYLPIEVKIYAQDQKEQCKDYLKKAKDKYSQGENARLCYLTIEGYLPDESSLGDMSDAERAQIIEISWRKDIIEWLDACVLQQNTIAKAPIREVLIQFKKAVQKFTNKLEENEEMEIKKLLINNQENFVNAEKIVSALTSARETLWNKLCDFIKVEIENNCNIEAIIPNDWNIHYKFSFEENNDFYTVACINANQIKSEISLLIVRIYNNGKTETTKACEKFSTSKLASEENFNKKAKECVDWIIEQLKVNGQM